LITIYTAPTCVICKRLKTYLVDNNIVFEEKDTTIDNVAMAELVSENIWSLPVIKTTDGKYHHGKTFDEYAFTFPSVLQSV
jgi:glutaredoxin